MVGTVANDGGVCGWWSRLGLIAVAKKLGADGQYGIWLLLRAWSLKGCGWLLRMLKLNVNDKLDACNVEIKTSIAIKVGEIYLRSICYWWGIWGEIDYIRDYWAARKAELDNSGNWRERGGRKQWKCREWTRINDPWVLRELYRTKGSTDSSIAVYDTKNSDKHDF